MGCLVFKHDALEKVEIQGWNIYDTEVKLFAGNPYDEQTDALVIVTSDFPVIEHKYLNSASISLLETCVKYLKACKSLAVGSCFFTSSVNARFVAFAAVPKYVDGTLGEPDYLDKAMKEAFVAAGGRSPKSLVVCIDCVYPKRLLVKAFVKILKEFISKSEHLNIKLYSNQPQIVKNI